MSKFDPQDRFFKKAKEEGYRARSAFKLQAVQDKFSLIKSGDKVLDLGAAPGSFLQYISKIIGKKGIAVGVDLQDIESFSEENIYSFIGDVFEDSVYRRIEKELQISEFDVITSDLAPKTTGITFMDGGASLDLSLKVLDVAKTYLKKGGNCVMKILSGFNEGDLISVANKMFRQVKKSRPQAIRKSSGESYIVCLGKY